MSPRPGWTSRHAASARDTIFALSTPPGRSAVAVIRISGPRAGAALVAMIGRELPAPRIGAFARFRDPTTQDTLDTGLALWFPGPASFTGEDCAELQSHGSLAATSALCGALSRLPDLREAEPGEFTQRAFAHGKLDGAQVEALADLIDAQTGTQRRLALRAYQDGPAKLAHSWRDRVLDMLAEIDARLDFSDEGDVDPLREADLGLRVRAFGNEVSAMIVQADRTRRLREGFVVALCGPPNSGKSSLLNALVGREQAIVSPYSGTTRDPIEVSLDLDGTLVTLVDTAGMRETADPVETIGIERARRASAHADLTVWLEAPDAHGAPDPSLAVDLHIATKSDLGCSGGPWSVSAVTREGIDHLLAEIARRAWEGCDEMGDAAVLRDRHIERARDVARYCEEAADHVLRGSLELGCAVLRGALAPIAALGSKAVDKDVLDRIFGRFCIGK